MKSLLLNNDDAIVKWTVSKFGYQFKRYDLAIGITENFLLVASVIFSNYTGDDIELSYYGPKTVTLGIARKIAIMCIDELKVSRVTVRTARNNKIMTRSIKKLGFVYEGIRKHGYGKYDAIMFGIYGKNLMRLAGRTMQ